MDCDVLVIGAGPGGCAVAHTLRRAGWRVILAERRTYPVDKLCGEFLSPEGLESLARMGLATPLEGGDFPSIDKVLLSSVAGRCRQERLPTAGLGCSRRFLDQLLLECGRSIGVEVVEGLRIRTVEGDFERGFRLQGVGPGGAQQFSARLVVGAYGKSGGLKRPSVQDRSRKSKGLMALKLHLRGGELAGRVELHSFPGGYAGLCQVEGGRVNLCLLTRVAAFREAGGHPGRFAEKIMRQNPLLGRRLEELAPDWEGVLALGNLEFGRFRLESGGVVRVGDAAVSISPLCGDGMAMALRAAELLSPTADEFLAGQCSGTELVGIYQRCWQKEFRLRLHLGRLLQNVLLRSGWTRAALATLDYIPGLGQGLIRWTRGL